MNELKVGATTTRKTTSELLAIYPALAQRIEYANLFLETFEDMELPTAHIVGLNVWGDVIYISSSGRLADQKKFFEAASKIFSANDIDHGIFYGIDSRDVAAPGRNIPILTIACKTPYGPMFEAFQIDIMGSVAQVGVPVSATWIPNLVDDLVLAMKSPDKRDLQDQLSDVEQYLVNWDSEAKEYLIPGEVVGGNH